MVEKKEPHVLDFIIELQKSGAIVTVHPNKTLKVKNIIPKKLDPLVKKYKPLIAHMREQNGRYLIAVK